MDIKLLKRLREETGASFADCKEALIESDNSYEKALEIVKKKKQERERKEQISWKSKQGKEVCVKCGKYLIGFNHSECEKGNKPIYIANGKHFSCYYDDMFYETLGDDFQQDDCIVVVEVEGENFKTFSDTEDKNQAYELFNHFSFREIGYADYGDWDELSSIIGKEEVEQLRKIYFDCDDYAETTWTVLLYHNFTYVTLVRD
jgi:hypothetical protein|tara:strand:- start:63 stop:671 length:609 start_codon:yes stop_codon:yes gene_type:complete